MTPIYLATARLLTEIAPVVLLFHPTFLSVRASLARNSGGSETAIARVAGNW